jgi:MoaD family protein
MPLVKLFANLRKLVGTKEFAASGRTVGEVLHNMIEKHSALQEVIFEGEHLHPHIVITLNGHNVTDLNVSVNEQDVIAIFPPMAGG